MKKVLFISYLLILNLFAQDDNQSQSIELPDFVITGKENISVPKIQKQYPAFIPLLTEEFFTPESPNEEQTTLKLPSVENEVINIGSYKQLTNAFLKFSAGLETWPYGEFYYNDWTGNLSYDAHLFGRNELEFVKNAGLSIAGFDLGTKYSIDHNSNFLPGSEISFSGNYFYESFNFYGSATPNLERATNNGFADLSFNYLSDPINKFGLSISDLFYEQKDDEISENIFGTNAFYQLSNENFDIELKGSYKNQTLSSNYMSYGNQYFYNSKATVSFKYNGFNIRAGAYFSESENNSFFSPLAEASIKLNSNITLFGEFSPNTEFKTLKDFRTANRYYLINNFVNLFIENKFNLKFAFRYEYEKYFEISGGAGYLNSDNNFYFEENLSDGFFTIQKEDIESSYAFLNLIFRKGPFGEFYAQVEVQDVIAENKKRLPYSSLISGSFNYAYDWDYGFGIKLGLQYYSDSYTDYENVNKIPEMIDLSAATYYELFRNFRMTLEFENLLNNEYYYFRNYKAKPFDVLLGFEFRW